MSDLKIPEDLKGAYLEAKMGHNSLPYEVIMYIERIAQQDALLREYRNNHFPEGHKCRLYQDGEDLRCDLCKRTDQQLQPKGEQG